MRLLPVALLVVTALCSAAEPWLAVTVPPRTRESLPATIRMWYRLACLGVLPGSPHELERPVAAMRGNELVLRSAEDCETAWIIHADNTITREGFETFIGDWRQPSAEDLERAATITAGMLPTSPPLRPDRLMVSTRESGWSWNIRWARTATRDSARGSSLSIGPDGRISVGGWGRSSSRCCCGGFSEPAPPSGGG